MTVDRILAVAGPVAADSKCIPLAFAFAVAVQLGRPFAVVAVVVVAAAVVAAVVVVVAAVVVVVVVATVL